MASDQESKSSDQHNIEIGVPQPADHGRTEKRLARGLEDVSYLFISRAADGVTGREETRGSPAEQAQPKPAQPPAVIVLCPSPAVNRDQLVSLLSKNTAALEEGMRAIDVNIPCEPYSPIGLLAVDSANQLAIIDLDTSINDGMLLRATCHFDWLLRNIPIVRRMYHGHVINFSTHPRIFLVAPQFSPMLTCAARRITDPRVNCIRYHSVAVPNGAGIFFEYI